MVKDVLKAVGVPLIITGVNHFEKNNAVMKHIAATFGVDTVVLGGSRRATLVNLLKGNVVARVAANLPESMHLVVIG